MAWTELLLGLLLGLIAAAALWWQGRQRRQVAASQQQQLQEELTEQQSSLGTATQLAQERQVEIATLQTELKNARENRLSQEAMQKQFLDLATQALGKNSESFVKSSSESLGNLLKPVREQLREFGDKAAKMYQEEGKERASLVTQIKLLNEANQRIGEEAQNLTRALKGDSQVRGEWGEMLLERLLEGSGLKEGRDYEAQKSMLDEDSRRLRPDVIVHLPQQRDVVIDSKVSLVAWEALNSCDDEEQSKQLLKEHVQSLRAHLKELAGKDYHQLPEVRSLDLVLMFVPLEPALLTALQQDERLYNEAWQKRIAIVGPTTLFAVLRIIENLWRLDRSHDNALDISRQASEISKKFNTFLGSLDGIGKSIDQAANKYQEAYKQLATGRGNLKSRIDKLSKIEADTNTLPAEDGSGSSELHALSGGLEIPKAAAPTEEDT